MNEELLASMRSGAAGQFTGVPARPAHENDAIPKIAPKWLKHDRQVSQKLSLDRSRFLRNDGGFDPGEKQFEFFYYRQISLCWGLLDAMI